MGSTLALPTDGRRVTRSRKFEKLEGSVLANLEDMVDHHIGRGPKRFEVVDGFVKKSLGVIAADARKDDQSRVDFFAAHELAEIDRILGDDDPVFGEAAGQHGVIRFAEAAHVPGVNRVMLARLIQDAGEERRQALVDEQSQAAFAQGRPPGRPTRGWVRA